MTGKPIILGYERISGGDWMVTVSLKPGQRIHVQVPAAVFDAGALPELISHVVDRVQPAPRPAPE